MNLNERILNGGHASNQRPFIFRARLRLQWKKGEWEEQLFFPPVVNSSTKLKKKLSFMNEHQKCIMFTYKEKYEKAKQELISLQARNVSSSAVGEDSNTTKESMVHIEDELRMV